ncbi:MAG TPA: porin [Planctomycetota bacterium]|jgi:hypothetical protein
MSKRLIAFCLLLACAVLGNACLAAEPGMADVLARLKALEDKNRELELKLKQAEARPSVTAAVDKVLSDAGASAAKVGAVITAPDATCRPLKIGGYLDVSYEYNLTRPDNQKNNLRIFDQDSNGFNVHLAKLFFERLPTKPGEAGFRVDLAFGTDARFFAAQDNTMDTAERGSAPFEVDLEQAYLEYIADVGNGITLDFGKMVTMHGAEVIEAADNINSSRGLLFGFAIPATHTGARASYEVFKDKWKVMAGIFNGWDNIQDQNNAKTGMLQSTWTPNKWFTWVVGAMYGDEQFIDERAVLRAQTALPTLANPDGGPFSGSDLSDPTIPEVSSTLDGRLWNSNDKNGRFLVDTIFTFTPWEKWTFVLNGDYCNESSVPTLNGVKNRQWYGAAGYIKYQFAKNWYIANRTEWFNDPEGVRTGMRQSLWESTITADWALSDPLHIRFEYRHDESNRRAFSDDRGVGSLNDPYNISHPFKSRGQDTLMMQWLYKF